MFKVLLEKAKEQQTVLLMHWATEKAEGREGYGDCVNRCFIDYRKGFDCVEHIELSNVFEESEI